ncbi:MAG TPA: type II toxin-antitoxin system MqsA family antitoxin [Anaerolineales bacterium]|nr:type II toxin-antitoxin system MqsA family antitoxin [Anaerolineales bacterium]
MNEETIINCSICKHEETHPGHAVVTLQRENQTLVFKGVPAEIYENYGEYYLSEEIARMLYQQTEESVRHGAEVEISQFVMP